MAYYGGADDVHDASETEGNEIGGHEEGDSKKLEVQVETNGQAHPSLVHVERNEVCAWRY